MTTAQQVISLILKFKGKDQGEIDDAVQRFGKLEDKLEDVAKANKKVEKAIPKASLWQRYSDAVEKAKGKVIQLAGKAQAFGRGVTNTGAKMSILSAGIVAGLGGSLKAWDAQEKALAQVRAGMEATGNAAGLSIEQLQKAASELQNTSLFGDEQILQGVTAQLQTFTNIAGDQFLRTQKAAVDLSAKLGTDLQSSTIQLGKALNDPVANLSALSRSGIQFSKDQKKVIKSLTESGQLAKAQSIILDELEKQYGGAAEAAAKEGLGPLTQIMNRLGDFSEVIGGTLEPVLNIIKDLTDKFVTFLEKTANTNPRFLTMGVILAGVVAAAGPLLVIVGSLITALGAVGGAVASVGLAPLIGIIAGVTAGVGLLWAAWQTLWPVVQQAVGAIRTAVSEWVAENQPLIDSIKLKWFELKNQAKFLFETLKVAFQAISQAVKTELDKMLQPFGGTEEAMKTLMTRGSELVGSFLETMKNLFSSAAENLPKVVDFVKNVIAAFLSWKERNSESLNSVLTSWNSIKESLVSIWGSIIGGISSATQAIVKKLDQWLEPIGGLRGAWEAYKNYLTFLFDTITSIFSTAFGVLAKNLKVIASVLSGQTSVWEGFKQIVANNAEGVKKVVFDLVERIKTSFGELPSKLKALATDMVSGLVNGLKAGISKVGDAAKALADMIPAGVKKVLNIQSPSRVMQQMGGFVVAGLALGIAVASPVVKAAEETATAAVEAFEKKFSEAEGVGQSAMGRLFGSDPNSVDSLAGRESDSFSESGTATTVSQYTSDTAALQAHFAAEREIILAETQITEEQRRELLAESREAEYAAMIEASTMASGVQYAFNESLAVSLQGLINQTMTWQEALWNITQTIGQQMIQDITRMASTWITKNLLMQGIQKAGAALSATLRGKDTAQAVAAEGTKAAAAAPAATLASISSYGAAAAIGLAAVAAAIAAFGGFQSGGYTGSGGVSDIAGVVHGQEFVSNARTTARERGFLEYLHRGGSSETIINNSYAAGAGSASPTVIMVDSRARADEIAAGIDGAVTIQDVDDRINSLRS